MPPWPDGAEGAPSAYPHTRALLRRNSLPGQVASSAAGWRRHLRPARQRLKPFGHSDDGTPSEVAAFAPEQSSAISSSVAHHILP